jgi:hypothetical protein
MSIVNAYWIPEPSTLKSLNPKFEDLGFRHDIPWPLPTTVGAEYFSEGREKLALEKELNKTVQGEYFPRGGNVLPSSGGMPLVNPFSKVFTHERVAYSVPFRRPQVKRI